MTIPFIKATSLMADDLDGNTTDATQEMLQRSFDEVKSHQMTFEAFPEWHQ